LSFSLRIAVISDCASLTASGEVAWTRSWLSEPYPVSDSCTALTGAMATSFGSLNPLPPFSASTPTTVKSLPETVICLESGSTLPKSSSATVEPITTTLRDCLTSSSVNSAPLPILKFDAPT
jgi:hypothetical protein